MKCKKLVPYVIGIVRVLGAKNIHVVLEVLVLELEDGIDSTMSLELIRTSST